ncbi:inositol monophosphatase family protein [Paractinoplanes brasiliensis]|uniref:Myo-inositol-1(Or 4)-monophosphatase n=1 Tax=Paractinoplanes brasiliensis TaxID=52695 RepID=A0A4R6J8H3_9ACTN|nr:inositol monophosphatase family protein [Actinoplanes brasiliensis]TDO31903.1 myo-inositol-1(or 4)-monophosphatase [Actinoplanes brasiliensis]GID27945.1 phosphatase [Actinoplanes brasiliensis]
MVVDDAELAVAAAVAGATVVREHYGTELAHFEKAPGDFATEADLAAEEAILGMLRAARPGDAFVGEESGRNAGGPGEREWFVDPLCGTLNYAVNTMLVSVNVALRDGQRIVAAASADPFAGEVFWTDGVMARVRETNGQPESGDKRLQPDDTSGIVDLNLDPPFLNAPRFRAARLLLDDRFVARFKPRVVSSTLAVAWVAAGRRAAYVTDGDLRDSVHFAAGIGLCQAAGCVVTALDGGPLHSGSQGLVAAADSDTHSALLEMVAAQLSG